MLHHLGREDEWIPGCDPYAHHDTPQPRQFFSKKKKKRQKPYFLGTTSTTSPKFLGKENFQQISPRKPAVLGRSCPKSPRPPGSSLRPGSFAAFRGSKLLAKQVYLYIYSGYAHKYMFYMYIYIYIYI